MPDDRGRGSRRPGALAFLASLLLGLAASPASAQALPGPVHVFLFIGDGMGRSSELVASRYLTGGEEGLAWAAFPYRGWATTWDVDTYDRHAAPAGAAAYDPATADPRLGYDEAVGGTEPWFPGAASDPRAWLLGAATDSAAAATAMATGRKTDAGNIAWERGDPPGGSLQTIAERLRRDVGAAIGVLSTVPFNHATPAAFLAHATGRSSYAEIAAEIIDASRPEVLIGGGHPDSRGAYLSRSALAGLRLSGSWSLVELRAGVDGGAALAAAAADLPSGRGLFGLFGARSDGALEGPVPAARPGFPAFTRGTRDPSLAQMVTAAATVLSRDPDGFFLMAEQGDIDGANHDNDLPRMIGAVASLDEAVRAAIAFVERPGDAIDWANSLVIVTADHATGLPRWEAGLSMRRGELPTRRLLATATWDYAAGPLRYATTGHGNELVTVAARGNRAREIFALLAGAGSGRPGTSIMDNTKIYEAIAAFAGLAP